MQKNAMAILILTILLAFGAAGFSQAQYDTLSIYDLQFVPDPASNDLSPYAGDTVVVKGMVMHNPRDLWIGARWSAYIIDPDQFPNPWSGFFVVQNDTFETNTLFGFVEAGTICYFTGVVAEFSSFSQITLLTDPLIPVDILSVGNPLPDPLLLTADDLDVRADAEQWESMWVRVEDATIVNNSVAGNWASYTDVTGAVTFMGEYFNWFRDRLNAGSYSWPANGTNFNVIGFMRDEPAGYTINPRDTLDLEILTNPPVISTVRRDPGAPTPGDNVTVSATIVDNGSVASAKVHYSVDWGAFQEVAMTASADTFSGTIPVQGDGAFVRYFISATDNSGEFSKIPGDTSRATGRVYFYVVRDGNLQIQDVQYTYGYPVDISGYVGYDVNVEGVVMTDSTDFLGDYWIQDARAPWSGLWVNDGDHTFVKGDWISVTGRVEENFNVTRLNNVTAASLVQAGFGVYEPIQQTTGNITTGADSAEAYESVLVQLNNVTISDPFPDAPSNFGEFEIDDGSGGLRVDDFFSAFRGNLDSAFVLNDKYTYIRGMHYYSFSNYKLAPRDSLDIGPLTGIEDDVTAPLSYSLSQNYPNPFNPSTTIGYTLAQSGKFTLEVFNVLGQRVATLVDRFQTAGAHQVTWNGRNDAGKPVGSGIYFYKLSGNNTTLTQKMILLK